MRDVNITHILLARGLQQSYSLDMTTTNLTDAQTARTTLLADVVYLAEGVSRGTAAAADLTKALITLTTRFPNADRALTAMSRRWLDSSAVRHMVVGEIANLARRALAR